MNQSGSTIEKRIASGILLLLLVGCLFVLWPFVTAIVWATVLSISLLPLHRRVIRMIGGRQTLAAALQEKLITDYDFVPPVIKEALPPANAGKKKVVARFLVRRRGGKRFARTELAIC